MVLLDLLIIGLGIAAVLLYARHERDQSGETER